METETTIDKCNPDPEEQAIFSRLDFTLVGQDLRIRCSHCGTCYRLRFYEGTWLNMFECGHHPDWYYLHALRLPDGTVLIWECCQSHIRELDQLGQIPPELILPPAQLALSYHDLVQSRFDQGVPKWLKKMDEEFFFSGSGFSQSPHEFARREND
ncbi:MAG: hypothetical protein V1826_00250 [bacterium]